MLVGAVASPQLGYYNKCMLAGFRKCLWECTQQSDPFCPWTVIMVLINFIVLSRTFMVACLPVLAVATGLQDILDIILAFFRETHFLWQFLTQLQVCCGTQLTLWKIIPLALNSLQLMTESRCCNLLMMPSYLVALLYHANTFVILLIYFLNSPKLVQKATNAEQWPITAGHLQNSMIQKISLAGEVISLENVFPRTSNQHLFISISHTDFSSWHCALYMYVCMYVRTYVHTYVCRVLARDTKA